MTSPEASHRTDGWLQAVFQHATSGIALVAQDARPVRVNPSLARMLGYSAHELCAMGLLDAVHPEDREMERARFRALVAREGDGYPAEVRFFARGGEVVWGRVSAVLLPGSDPAPHAVLVMIEDVTERKWDEQHRTQAERGVRDLFDAVTEAIYVQDAGGHIVAVNEALVRMYGYAHEELLGRTPEVLVHPERTDPQAVRARAHRALAGEAQRLEIWGRRKNGRAVPVEVVLTSTTLAGQPAVVATARDITERKAAEEMLESERAHLEQLFQGSPEAIVLVDPSDRVLRINAAFSQLFGYAQSEALGRRLAELIIPSEEADAALCITRRIADGERLRLDTVRQHKDGARVEVSVAGAPVRVHGQHVAVYGIYQDIRERKELERTLWRRSVTDELTGLHNRRGFLEQAQREAVLARRRGQDLVLLYLDLDDFKQVNDRFGHAEGDRLLCDVAVLLRQSFRSTDLLARIGGDEFVVLAVEAAPDMEPAMVERVHEAVRRFNAEAGRAYELRISVGAHRAPAEHPLDLDILLAESDRRMYRSKQER